MTKTFLKSLLYLISFISFSSCTYFDINTSPDNNSHNYLMEKSHVISIENALDMLNQFLKDTETDTRTFSQRQIKNIYTVSTDINNTRSTIHGSSCENLLYIANFHDKMGYAIIAADDRITEKIIAVTDHGNLERETIQENVTSLQTNSSKPEIIESRPIFPDYPLYGEGFFTLEEYGDELFMNPNTVNLYIESEDDTLIGNLNCNLPDDTRSENTNDYINTQIQNLSFSLCVDYALNEISTYASNPKGGIGNNPDNGAPDQGLTPSEPVDGGGEGYNYDKVTITYSDWRIKNRVIPLLQSFLYWHGYSPFNNYYPERHKWIIFGHKEKAPSGCFPIAMAKIMTFMKFPSNITYQGNNIDWEELSSISNYYPLHSSDKFKESAATLLKFISEGCGSWYFEQGTFTFPKKARSFMKKIGFKNVESFNYNFSRVSEMLNNGKPVIIYSIPGVNIIKAHAWNIDGYKTMERSRYTNLFYEGSLVHVIENIEKKEMVHCDFGWQSNCNGYYISGIFNLEEDDMELDPGVEKGNHKENFNHYLRTIIYNK